MKDWKTTAMGIAGALFAVWQPLVMAYDGGEIEWARFGMAGAIAMLGYFAGDSRHD